MEVKPTDGCTQTVLCALIESLLSMRPMSEPKKKGKAQEIVSREIKHSERKSVPVTQAALQETLCPQGGKMAVWGTSCW